MPLLSGIDLLLLMVLVMCLFVLLMSGALEDIDMTHCLQAAYNEIKDRKGYLNKDGVFIKDELRPC
jgi:cell division protein FtsL